MGEITTGIKLAVGGAVLAIILVVCGVLWYQHSEVGSLQKAAGADTAVIADQQAAASNAAVTIGNQQQTAVITDNTTQAIASATMANAASQATVEQQTDQKIDTINQQYQPPVPPANIAPAVAAAVAQAKAAAAAKSKAISQVQIDSLWTTFCNTTPDSVAQCKAIAPTAASSAS